MRYALLTFDLEEFTYPIESGQTRQDKRLFDLSKNGLDRLIKVLNFKATFFTTEEYANRFPSQISWLAARGHEIGLHGVTHTAKIDYRALQEARRHLEHRFGIKVFGFRPPRFCSVEPKRLASIGFSYSSSTHPRIGSRQWLLKRGIHSDYGLTEVPVSTTHLLRLPFSWVWFRNLGSTYAKICTLGVLANSPYMMLYFHPWDFSDLTLSGYKLPWYFKRHSGDWMVENLSQYVDWLRRNGIKPVRVMDFLRLG